MRDNTQGLAYIVEISNVEPLEGKDRIVLASNNKNTLKSIISKDDLGKDNLFIFFEADTLIPDCYTADKEIYNKKFKFLEPSKKKGSTYYRICARKMGGIVSMGLLVPMADLIEDENLNKAIRQKYAATGIMDLTQYFELQKYEPPIPNTNAACLTEYNALYHEERSFNEIPITSYPIHLTDKSDEENFFNLDENFFKRHWDDPCYATIKLDGTSITYYIKDDTYYILGHNMMIFIPQLYKYTAYASDNIFDKIKRYESDTGRKLLVCGEFLGPKIQNNPYRIESPWNNTADPCLYGFYCYKMVSYKDEADKYTMGYAELKETCEKYNIPMVPLAWPSLIVLPDTLGHILGCIANVSPEDSFEEILPKIQESSERMTWNYPDFEKCQWTKEADGKAIHQHEGYVITSTIGHADGSNKGWSFKVKGQKYQALH